MVDLLIWHVSPASPADCSTSPPRRNLAYNILWGLSLATRAPASIKGADRDEGFPPIRREYPEDTSRFSRKGGDGMKVGLAQSVTFRSASRSPRTGSSWI